jgi:hypothetical protein
MISVGIPARTPSPEPEETIPSLEAILLAGEHSTEVADLMWKNVDLLEVPGSAPAMSEEVLDELVTTRDAAQLKALGEKLPAARVAGLTDPQVLALAEGLVKHPLVSAKQLEVIVEDGGLAAAAATTRLERAATLAADLAAGRDATESYRAVAAHNEVSAVTDALESSTEAALVMLATTPMPEWEEDRKTAKVPNLFPFRGKVVKDLARVNPDADELIDRLLAVTDPSDPASAAVVDEFLVEWLCESDSIEAEVARALLVPEGGVNRSTVAVGFVNRLTQAARMRLRKHDVLWDLVAYKTKERKPRAPRARRAGEPIMASVDQLMAYKLADIDVTPQFLSSNLVVDPDEFTMLLEGISPMAAANFLVGQTPRRLEEGQVSMVLDLFDEDEKEELFEFVKRSTEPLEDDEDDTEDDDEEVEASDGTIVDEATAKAVGELENRANGEDALPWHVLIQGLPWRDELVRYIPGSLQEPAGMYASFNAVLTELLGDDADAWAKALAIAPTWTGSLDELAEAVR